MPVSLNFKVRIYFSKSQGQHALRRVGGPKIGETSKSDVLLVFSSPFLIKSFLTAQFTVHCINQFAIHFVVRFTDHFIYWFAVVFVINSRFISPLISRSFQASSESCSPPSHLPVYCPLHS